jgi:hypothetical protein
MSTMNVESPVHAFAAYTKAVSALLALASPLFKLAMNKVTDPEIVDAAFEHWHTLRRIAQIWLHNCSTALPTDEREKLVGVLRFAHEQAHALPACFGSQVVPRVEHCACQTAEKLRVLALLQVADATGVQIPEVAA